MIVAVRFSRDELITSHFYLVRSVPLSLAHKPSVRRLGDEAESLAQSALVHAAERYDARSGLFEPYAKRCIRNAILKAVGRDRSVSLPLEGRDLTDESGPEKIDPFLASWSIGVLYKLRHCEARLLQRRFGLLGAKQKTLAQIAAEDGVSTRTVARRLRYTLAAARAVAERH